MRTNHLQFALPAATLLGLLGGLAPTQGATVYTSLAGPSSDRGYNSVNFGEAGYDDLRVTSGGTIRSVSFAGRGGGFFGDPMSLATFYLFLDNGDGVPQVNPGSGVDPQPPILDTHLLTVPVDVQSYPQGEITVVTLDVESLGASIPAGGGLLWAGVEFSNSFSVTLPFVASPTVGTTDNRVWSFTNGFQEVPAVFDQGAQNAQALGFSVEVVPAPSGVALLGAAAALGARRRRR